VSRDRKAIPPMLFGHFATRSQRQTNPKHMYILDFISTQEVLYDPKKD
jgi:hypothetical protein